MNCENMHGEHKSGHEKQTLAEVHETHQVVSESLEQIHHTSNEENKQEGNDHRNEVLPVSAISEPIKNDQIKKPDLSQHQHESENIQIHQEHLHSTGIQHKEASHDHVNTEHSNHHPLYAAENPLTQEKKIQENAHPKVAEEKEVLEKEEPALIVQRNPSDRFKKQLDEKMKREQWEKENPIIPKVRKTKVSKSPKKIAKSEILKKRKPEEFKDENKKEQKTEENRAAETNHAQNGDKEENQEKNNDKKSKNNGKNRSKSVKSMKKSANKNETDKIKRTKSKKTDEDSAEKTKKAQKSIPKETKELKKNEKRDRDEKGKPRAVSKETKNAKKEMKSADQSNRNAKGRKSVKTK